MWWRLFIVLFLLPIGDAAAIGSTLSNPCGYNEAIDGPIPSGVRPCSDHGFKFHSDLYYATWTINASGKKHGPLRLIVYGTPTDVPERLQRYKKGWQPDPADASTVIDPPDGEGHSYVWDARYGKYTYGQYLYWGFDETGQPVHNAYFIRDALSTTEMGQKHWIRYPWRDLPASYPHRPQHPGVVYRAGDDPISAPYDGMKRLLTRSLGFSIDSGIDYDRPFSPRPDQTDPRAYVAIMQQPTMREGGFGTMYHYSWASRSVWFQTLPLAQMRSSEKTATPLLCTATMSDTPIALTKQRFITVPVTVHGTIDDDAFIGDARLRAMHVTREDIKQWRLTLEEDTAPHITAGNRASASFDVRIDTDALDRSGASVWKYTTRASVHIVLHDDTTQTQSCPVTITFQPSAHGSLHSDFSIVPQHVLTASSQLSASRLGYRDTSFGADADGYTFVITDPLTSSVASITYEPAVPERRAPAAGALDEAAVTAFLHTFIAQRLPPTSSQRFEKTFRISQFVFDRDVRSDRSSEAVRTVTIVMNPPESTCTPPPQVISPNTHWPTDWYDVVPMRVTDEAPSYIPSCTSAPSYASFTKSVFVDDVPIDAQAFFSHRYVFGTSAVGVRRVRVVWTAPDGTQSSIVRHVHIHSTQPRVHVDISGLYKARRRMEARIVQSAANDAWVEQRAPLQIKSFVISGDDSVQCVTCEGTTKVFAHNNAGTYAFHVQASRTITDDVGNTIFIDAPLLIVPYTITPDHPPAIIAHPHGKQISRRDPLDIVYDIQSTDGDEIASKTMRIYYDADNDGTCETLVSEHFGAPLSLPTFRNVGQYAYVVHAQEQTTQPVLPSYVPATDGTTATYTGYFVVDNYEPSSALYVDVPQPPPLVDVLYILDESLDTTSASAVRDAKVSITNAYTSANMRATIGIWDMRTFSFTQSASETIATGEQYPAPTRSYCANGYCGTLSLASVSNTPYSEDRGGMVTVTDTITASLTCTHTITGYYNRSGYWQLVTDSGDCPQTMPYDDGQYKGTLPRVSTTGTSCPYVGRPNATCTARFVATYTGPASWSRQVWQPQWVTINRYVGTYTGTITKSVRQQVDVSFFQAHSTKTFVYITDQTISSPSELEQLRTAHNTAQWVLVSGAAPAAAFRHDAYVALTNPIEPALASVVSTVQRNNPAVPVLYRLPGEPITTRTATFDAEKDPIIENEMWITQDATTFDYGQGYDAYAGVPLSPNKRDEQWFPYADTLSFQKVGKYTVFRRVRDQPHPDARFSQYRYRSNDSAIEVVVHRKPIADVDLSWTYDAPSGTYTTTWNDTSYDWDHRVSRSDRGIRARALTLYEEATATTQTSIPTSLAPGRYTLTYMAQDIEGAWSDPLVRTIDLPVSPPMQLFATAYTDDTAFSLNNIASGETISFAPRTKYPYKTHVEFWRDGTFVQRMLTPEGEHLGEKRWSPFVWNIPNTTPDGTYDVVLHAHGTDRTEQTIAQSASQSFSVRVNTPVQLNGRITTAGDSDVRTMRERKVYDLVATTTEYAQFVVVTAFAQTPYEQIVALRATPISTAGTGQTRWTAPLTLSASVPDGQYTFYWLSQTANNNVERQQIDVFVQTASPPIAQFTYTPDRPTEGDTLTLTDRSTATDGTIASRTWTIRSPTATTNATTPTVILPPLQAGTMTVTLRVVDTSGLSAETTQSITVNNLSLNAFVEHTPSWEAIRTRWNALFPSKTRDAATFWSGEALSLRAIASQANGVTPKSVDATLLSQQTALATSDKTTYTSVVVRTLPDGPYTMHFVAVWSNGHTETAAVPFTIRGSMYDVLRWHRRL